MRLRDLELKDAPFMLEWMQDESVVGKLRGDFKNKTLSDCEAFIKASERRDSDIHLAIANDYVILGASFEIIGNEEKNDPVKSLLAVRSSRDASENLDKTHLEINNYFYKNDILLPV